MSGNGKPREADEAREERGRLRDLAARVGLRGRSTAADDASHESPSLPSAVVPAYDADEEEWQTLQVALDELRASVDGALMQWRSAAEATPEAPPLRPHLDEIQRDLRSLHDAISACATAEQIAERITPQLAASAHETRRLLQQVEQWTSTGADLHAEVQDARRDDQRRHEEDERRAERLAASLVSLQTRVAQLAAEHEEHVVARVHEHVAAARDDVQSDLAQARRALAQDLATLHAHIARLETQLPSTPDPAAPPITPGDLDTALQRVMRQIQAAESSTAHRLSRLEELAPREGGDAAAAKLDARLAHESERAQETMRALRDRIDALRSQLDTQTPAPAEVLQRSRDMLRAALAPLREHDERIREDVGAALGRLDEVSERIGHGNDAVRELSGRIGSLLDHTARIERMLEATGTAVGERLQAFAPSMEATRAIASDAEASVREAIEESRATRDALAREMHALRDGLGHIRRAVEASPQPLAEGIDLLARRAVVIEDDLAQLSVRATHHAESLAHRIGTLDDAGAARARDLRDHLRDHAAQARADAEECARALEQTRAELRAHVDAAAERVDLRAEQSRARDDAMASGLHERLGALDASLQSEMRSLSEALQAAVPEGVDEDRLRGLVVSSASRLEEHLVAIGRQLPQIQQSLVDALRAGDAAQDEASHDLRARVQQAQESTNRRLVQLEARLGASVREARDHLAATMRDHDTGHAIDEVGHAWLTRFDEAEAALAARVQEARNELSDSLRMLATRDDIEKAAQRLEARTAHAQAHLEKAIAGPGARLDEISTSLRALPAREDLDAAATRIEARVEDAQARIQSALAQPDPAMAEIARGVDALRVPLEHLTQGMPRQWAELRDALARLETKSALSMAHNAPAAVPAEALETLSDRIEASARDIQQALGRAAERHHMEADQAGQLAREQTHALRGEIDRLRALIVERAPADERHLREIGAACQALQARLCTNEDAGVRLARHMREGLASVEARLEALGEGDEHARADSHEVRARLETLAQRCAQIETLLREQRASATPSREIADARDALDALRSSVLRVEAGFERAERATREAPDVTARVVAAGVEGAQREALAALERVEARLDTDVAWAREAFDAVAGQLDDQQRARAQAEADARARDHELADEARALRAALVEQQKDQVRRLLAHHEEMEAAWSRSDADQRERFDGLRDEFVREAVAFREHFGHAQERLVGRLDAGVSELRAVRAETATAAAAAVERDATHGIQLSRLERLVAQRTDALAAQQRAQHEEIEQALDGSGSIQRERLDALRQDVLQGAEALREQLGQSKDHLGARIDLGARELRALRGQADAIAQAIVERDEANGVRLSRIEGVWSHANDRGREHAQRLERLVEERTDALEAQQRESWDAMTTRLDAGFEELRDAVQPDALRAISDSISKRLRELLQALPSFAPDLDPVLHAQRERVDALEARLDQARRAIEEAVQARADAIARDVAGHARASTLRGDAMDARLRDVAAELARIVPAVAAAADEAQARGVATVSASLDALRAHGDAQAEALAQRLAQQHVSLLFELRGHQDRAHEALQSRVADATARDDHLEVALAETREVLARALAGRADALSHELRCATDDTAGRVGALVERLDRQHADVVDAVRLQADRLDQSIQALRHEDASRADALGERLARERETLGAALRAHSEQLTGAAEALRSGDQERLDALAARLAQQHETLMVSLWTQHGKVDDAMARAEGRAQRLARQQDALLESVRAQHGEWRAVLDDLSTRGAGVAPERLESWAQEWGGHLAGLSSAWATSADAAHARFASELRGGLQRLAGDLRSQQESTEAEWNERLAELAVTARALADGQETSASLLDEARMRLDALADASQEALSHQRRQGKVLSDMLSRVGGFGVRLDESLQAQVRALDEAFAQHDRAASERLALQNMSLGARLQEVEQALARRLDAVESSAARRDETLAGGLDALGVWVAAADAGRQADTVALSDAWQQAAVAWPEELRRLQACVESQAKERARVDAQRERALEDRFGRIESLVGRSKGAEGERDGALLERLDAILERVERVEGQEARAGSRDAALARHFESVAQTLEQRVSVAVEAAAGREDERAKRLESALDAKMSEHDSAARVQAESVVARLQESEGAAARRAERVERALAELAGRVHSIEKADPALAVLSPVLEERLASLDARLALFEGAFVAALEAPERDDAARSGATVEEIRALLSSTLLEPRIEEERLAGIEGRLIELSGMLARGERRTRARGKAQPKQDPTPSSKEDVAAAVQEGDMLPVPQPPPPQIPQASTPQPARSISKGPKEAPLSAREAQPAKPMESAGAAPRRRIVFGRRLSNG